MQTIYENILHECFFILMSTSYFHVNQIDAGPDSHFQHINNGYGWDQNQCSSSSLLLIAFNHQS